MSAAQRGSKEAGGGRVLDALRNLSGGPELLRAAERHEEAMLVGGAVRDLLLERPPRELDVVLAGEAAELGEQLRLELGGTLTLHGRFGTAVLEWPAGRIDIARRRAESYRAAGALPEVRPGTLEEDLARRDFTVNAIAASLAGPSAGELLHAEHALADLGDRRLRVLHERSFLDDPTRLLRLARYSARLEFEIEARTAELAREALAGGALRTVSGARVGGELRLALSEAGALAALETMDGLGILSAIAPGLRLDRPLAQRALALLPPDGRADLLAMASLLLSAADGGGDALATLLDDLEFPAAERERVLRAARGARALATALASAERPSLLHAALHAEPPEAIALAGVIGDAQAARAAHEWFDGLRDVRLAITGEDLLAAGLAPGPEIGRRLGATLARKLDGELGDGRDGELRAALEDER